MTSAMTVTTQAWLLLIITVLLAAQSIMLMVAVGRLERMRRGID